MDCIGKTLGNRSYRLSSRISVVTQRSWQGAPHYGCVGTFFPTLRKGLAWKYTLFSYKNVVFRAQAEYPYFSAEFRLKIFLYYS